MEMKIVAKKENYLVLCAKCPTLLPGFHKIWIFSNYFQVNFQYKISKQSVQREMNWSMRTDRRTKRKLSFFNYINAQKKKSFSTRIKFRREDFGGGRTRRVL